MKKKKLIVLLFPVLILVVSLVSLMNSFYAKILPIYAFGGAGVPLKYKINCALETEERVKIKFENPPNFDEESINSLKEFWHFSFYKECLYSLGYEFDGVEVPTSEVTTTNVYENPFVGFSFSVPAGTVIKQDNDIDVEYDNRLLVSRLESSSTNLNIHSFTSQDYENIQDIFVNRFSFSGTNGIIKEKEMLDRNGINGFYVRQDTAEGFVFMKDKIVVQVYSNDMSDEVKSLILSSFSFDR